MIIHSRLKQIHSLQTRDEIPPEREHISIAVQLQITIVSINTPKA